MKTEFAFGVIVVACAPGGGGSNIWAMLYGGDLDLSLAMTFFSKIIAVGLFLICVLYIILKRILYKTIYFDMFILFSIIIIS